MKTFALWFEKRGVVSVKEQTLAPPGSGEVLVETLFTAISPGTEMVVYRGEAPQEMASDATIASLQGNFAFPLKYGYAAVGRICEVGPNVDANLRGQYVFAFHPHESHFVEETRNLFALPQHMAPEDALFLPNLETALTLAHDGAPLAGEQVVIFGQGIVGLLLTAILSRYPLLFLATIDHYPLRREFSETVGAQVTLDPQQLKEKECPLSLLTGSGFYEGADLAYEISGNPDALMQAIEVTGYSGRVVIGSWYGTKKNVLDLGGNFHRKRILMLSSQVSTISPHLRGRFSKGRLLSLAWKLASDMKPSRFITHRFPVSHAAEAYGLLDTKPGEAVQVILTYGEEAEKDVQHCPRKTV